MNDEVLGHRFSFITHHLGLPFALLQGLLAQLDPLDVDQRFQLLADFALVALVQQEPFGLRRRRLLAGSGRLVLPRLDVDDAPTAAR